MEINPSSREVTTVAIDSADRTTGTESDFKLLFTKSIPGVIAYRVENITVPFSYLPYRQDLATLTFQITGNISGSVSATVANQQFTDTSFKTAFEAALLIALTGISTVEYNGGAITISNSVETLEITAGNLTASNGWDLIGFTIPVGPASSITANKFYNFSGDNRIYLHSQVMSGQNNYKIIQSQMTPTDSILSIPVNVNSGDTIYKEIPNAWAPCTTSDIRSIDFSLRFRDGTIINLNGRNWGAEISFLKNKV